MLLSILDYIQINPLGAAVTFAVFSLSLVVAITIHEFSHALSATLLGDNTARNLGRLTLRPLAHLDPIGTAMIAFVGFGWGKPTPVDPDRLNTGPRPGMALVALAGPISNVTVAIAAALPLNVGLIDARYVGLYRFAGDSWDFIAYFFGSLIFWNMLLATFNLIPIAPLDGFKVALGVLPREPAAQFARLEPYGPLILLGVIMLDYIVPGAGVLSSVIGPVLDTLIELVLGGQL